MKVYRYIRDWVDCQWRASSERFKILLLPAILPLLLIATIGKTPALELGGWAWFVSWSTFVFWRYWTYVETEAERADLRYDRKGKFQLSNEYHETESATAAKKRKHRD